MSLLSRASQLARGRDHARDAREPELLVVTTLREFDATQVAKGLFVGSVPPVGKLVRDAGFTLLILCAQPDEYARHYGTRGEQLDRKFEGVQVIRVPLDDSMPSADRPNRGRLSEADIRAAHDAAARASSAIAAGGKVLVTCRMGRNRSAFVAALAIHRLSGEAGPVCAQRIRIARGTAIGNNGTALVLYNPWFNDLLEGVR